MQNTRKLSVSGIRLYVERNAKTVEDLQHIAARRLAIGKSFGIR